MLRHLLLATLLIGCAATTDEVDTTTQDLAAGGEVGVISDLDDTLIPKAEPDLSLPPQPGIAELYDILEHRRSGRDGDVYYVTARKPERVKDVPKYLADNGVPAGPIETGTSGAPFIARPEKVKDIEKIFSKTGAQRFVLFGDTTHVDVDVQQDVLKKHPERVIAGIILKASDFDESRLVEGQYLVNDYAEAAAVLRELGVINRTEEKKVARAARP
ncbi:MAG: phosphatase domain-containing protein [Labilithrix sp.]